MVIPGVDANWDALQYHIHAGSDHTLDGKHYGADLHIVHKNRNGSDYAVLGLFLEPSNAEVSGLMDVPFRGWESVARKTAKECNTFRRRKNTDVGKELYNPYLLVPPNFTTYFYSGSLTTPPCSEVVTWNVVDTPVSLSVREFTRIVHYILDYVDPDTCKRGTVASPAGSTGRPVQPLNGRTITHKCPTGTESAF
jgi:carbonic anhydrase